MLNGEVMNVINDMTKDDTNVMIGIILNPITIVNSGTMTNIVNIALIIVKITSSMMPPRLLLVSIFFLSLKKSFTFIFFCIWYRAYRPSYKECLDLS